MFGDEIESIRQFDRGSQRSLRSLDEAEITVLTKQRTRQAHLAGVLAARDVRAAGPTG